MLIMYLSFFCDENNKSLFERIYNDNYEIMLHVAFGITNEKMEAENAVHDSFLKIVEHFERYKKLSCSEIRALCVTIVKHKAIDVYRKNSKISEEELDNLILYNEYTEFLPEEQIEKDEESEILRSILEKLPERDKEILYLKFYCEFDNKEIAQVLDISTKYVEVKLYRAKNKLKEILDNEKTVR